jgi:phosphoribosyl-AMP cyclohydrolase
MKQIVDFYKGNGLVPAIIQDYQSGVVYMLGYMNNDAFKNTNSSGFVYFWSRSKKRLWMKGETSGNKLRVKEILKDCDNDTLLVKVELCGRTVCHTRTTSCFFTKL